MGAPKLHGVRFLYTEQERPKGSIEDRGELRAELARGLGAHVIQVLQAGAEAVPTFRLTAVEDSDCVLTQLVERHHDELPLPVSSRLSEITDADIAGLNARLASGERFELKHTRHTRKHGAYVIEHGDQLATLLELRELFPDKIVFSNCELSQHIETPGNYASLFRLNVAPTGKILAAGLLRAERPKGPSLRVDYNGTDDLGDDELTFLAQHLEDPESRHFLAAWQAPTQEISEDHVIPLTGLGSRIEIPDEYAHVLDAYGIDPWSRRIPEPIRNTTNLIGRNFGASLDLILAVDFAIDKRTKRTFLKRIDPAQSATLFAKCHPGEPGSDEKRMHLTALNDIALSVNG